MRARGTPRPQAALAAMGIQGMELCAMAVVVLLFIAVLKQFGILEPVPVKPQPGYLIGAVRPAGDDRYLMAVANPFPDDR